MKLRITNLPMLLLSTLGFALITTSCNRYYYQPNPVNAPMLTERNDLKLLVSGNFGIDELDDIETKNSTLNLSAAYSPVKHLGLMTSFTNYKYDITEPNPAEGKVDAHATLFEGGVGGYYPIMENSRGFKLVADTYIGYGGGKLNSDVDMNFNRLFIQPGFNFTTLFFDVGLAARISGIKYSDFNSNGMTQEYVNSQGLANITDGRKYFFEPALTLRGGYKFIKGQLQIVRSEAFKTIDWRYDDNMITFGVFFSIEEFMKLKK